MNEVIFVSLQRNTKWPQRHKMTIKETYTVQQMQNNCNNTKITTSNYKMSMKRHK